MFRKSVSLFASIIVLAGAGSAVIAPAASAATPNPVSSQYCAYTESATPAGASCSTQVAVPAHAASAVQSVSPTFSITATPGHASSATAQPSAAHVKLLRQPGLRRPA